MVTLQSTRYEFRRFLTELGFPENTNSVPSLDLKLSANELAIGKTVDEIVPAAKKTISILPATDDKCYYNMVG
jgi:hypothetical protein